jgi:hypothetical protein
VRALHHLKSPAVRAWREHRLRSERCEDRLQFGLGRYAPVWAGQGSSFRSAWLAEQIAQPSYQKMMENARVRAKTEKLAAERSLN